MYTVVRILGPSDATHRIGEILNNIQVGVYQGPRKAGDGFACSIAEDEDWCTHVGAALEFLERFWPALEMTQELGVSVEFDTAVEPEDLGEHYLSLHIDGNLLRKIESIGATYTITFYR